MWRMSSSFSTGVGVFLLKSYGDGRSMTSGVGVRSWDIHSSITIENGVDLSDDGVPSMGTSVGEFSATGGSGRDGLRSRRSVSTRCALRSTGEQSTGGEGSVGPGKDALRAELRGGIAREGETPPAPPDSYCSGEFWRWNGMDERWAPPTSVAPPAGLAVGVERSY